MSKLMTTTATVIATLLAPAHATALDIYNDTGGNVGTRVATVEALRKSGEVVRVIGTCASACTLILSLPAWQVCAVKGAEFAFHALTLTAKSGSDEPLMKNGRRVMAPSRMQESFANRFPQKIRAWMYTVGALQSFDFVVSPATDFVHECLPEASVGKPVGNTWFTQ